ncbi:MAG: alpha/beta fold hydrolase [Hylemonella sp.]
MDEGQARSLPLDGGGALALRVWEPAGAPQASVVIGAAMGVPQSYYAAYAAWLAQQGYRVWTFDYRGHGESRPATPAGTLRGLRADLLDWVRDYEAVVALARAEAPQRPLFLIGHSLGAQLPGLFGQPQRVDGLLSIAAGSGYWRDNAARLRRRVLLFWHVVVPLATGLCGYFPGRRLGMVGNLPAGVIRQWRRWCLHPRYSAAEGEQALASYARVRFPILAWTFSDDEMMTLRATRHLLALYANAPHQVHTWHPVHARARRIGHFGLFRATFRDTLWPHTVAALQALPQLGAGGVPQTTDVATTVPHTADHEEEAPTG